MSDDNDDLEGWQLVLLLVFFFTVGGGLYLIGWLTRPNFFSDHPLVCAAIAGAACYPARFLVERFAWWNNLEQRRAESKHRRASASGSRGRRGWAKLVRGLRVVFGVPIALGSLAILPLGISADRENQNLVKHGPIQQAVVVSVEKDKWSKYDDVTVKVARPSDGKPIELEGGNDLNPRPHKGDRLDVVVDPKDPTTIISPPSTGPPLGGPTSWG
ncbi:hypothetical protein EV138_1815 [Kribbella voronezhensis]|uniref:Uncharacterized protein n=1 Tax=Kribbella voronezhensis TaxID=2512212 RepID=A0A4V3FJZ9_9ACTN|nr:hypothetical protein [Kribbella voronezhensis]TDU88273.1 hypothetical protein EV138_1815 [Kribbella voronezhensis]